MTDFFKQITISQSTSSLRALMQAWSIPKHYQGEFRQRQLAKINGQYHSLALPVTAGDQLTLEYHAEAPDEIPSYRPIPVIYEDQDLLIVDKPAGLKTHPSMVGDDDTALGRVRAYLNAPVFITHRLDMATSGLLLFAKDPLTQAIVNRQLATKTMHRNYVALVAGTLSGHGSIDAPIAHAPNDIRRRMVAPDGLPARTHYTATPLPDGTSRVHLTLETGRTHQLRVHLDHIGHPILGDPLYGNFPGPRLALHAAEMTLTRPFGQGPLTINSHVPF